MATTCQRDPAVSCHVSIISEGIVWIRDLGTVPLRLERGERVCEEAQPEGAQPEPSQSPARVQPARARVKAQKRRAQKSIRSQEAEKKASLISQTGFCTRSGEGLAG